MVAIKTDEFVACMALRHKAGSTHSIDDIATLEIAIPFTYDCTVGGQRFSGKALLYAFPDKLKELILGHIVLDILPPMNEETFTYRIEENDVPHVIITADTATPNIAEVPPLPDALMTMPELIETMDRMLTSTGKWSGTGCFHRAALYYPINKFLTMTEDIGRHNCIDRLKGHCLMRKLSSSLCMSNFFLFTTARITASMYIKIHKAGIRTIISHAAITSTAYKRAQQDGCTLAAFCRPHEARVTLFHDGMKNIAIEQ